MIARDLRWAIRTFAGAPQTAAVSVLLLALGVGANTVLFALADAVMFRPFPFRDQRRLVIAAERVTATRAEVSYANFRDWRARARTFDGLAAMGSSNWTMTLRAADPVAIPYRAVTNDFFDVLGARAALGRTFRPADDVRGAPRVVVISHGLWQRQFGGDPAVVARSIVLSEQPFTIVGVMPRGFAYPAGADAWAPLVPALADIRGPSLPDFVEGRGAAVLHVVGRLKADASLAGARDELDRIIRQLAEDYGVRPANATSDVAPLVDDLLGSVRVGLWALVAAVALLLLATTANVAGLLLVQISRRRRELAIRMALGASCRDMMRQLLLESALLVGAAAALAALMARAALPLVLAFASRAIPRVDEAAIDSRVMLFTAVVGGAAAVVCWIAPALTIGRASLDAALRATGHSVATAGFSGRARRLLVGGEIAVAVVVLAGAGLLLRSVSRLTHLDLGFDANRLLAIEVGLSPDLESGSRDGVYRFYTRAIDAVATTPLVQSVAAVSGRPLKGPIGLDSSWRIESQPADVAERNPWVNLETITPSYFRTMGTRLIAGRVFDDGDRATTAPVVVVNEKLAQWAWPGQPAIGKRIRGGGLDLGRTPPPWWTVVGVVADIRYRELGAATLDVYVPFQQSWFPVGDLVIRTTGPAANVVPAVRARLRAVSPDGIVDAALMERVVAAHEAPWTTNLMFFAIFAALTIALAAVGLYAMLAAMVAERARELGVRAALGASGRRIVREVVGDGLRIAVPGVAAGVAASLVLGRFIRVLLFEVSPLDAPTLIAVPVMLVAVAAAACVLPALRASRVDPAVCLRAE